MIAMIDALWWIVASGLLLLAGIVAGLAFEWRTARKALKRGRR